MKTKEQLLNLIRNYFYTVYEIGEISSQETMMCLQNYLTLLLTNKNIDSTSVNYVIHKVDMKKFDDNSIAKLIYEDNIFHIYLNANNFSFSHISQQTKIIKLFIHFGHEVQHMLQYILAPKLMEKYDDYLFDLEMKTHIIEQGSNTRENRKLTRKLKNLLAINRDVSKIELNATYRAYTNFVKLLEDIIKKEQNHSFVNFILCMFEQIEHYNILDIINDTHLINQGKSSVLDLIENHNQDPETTKLF